MSAPAPSGPSVASIVLRFAVFIALVLAATWVAHQVRDTLIHSTVTASDPAMRGVIAVGIVAYILLLAMPFVPGTEIGIALLTAFGATIAPVIYVSTVVSLMLAFTVGQLLPLTALVRLLDGLRLRKAADLVRRAAPLSRDDRVAMVLNGATPRVVSFTMRHRYIALALAVNLPGTVAIGGGGGIMLMVGLSRFFAPIPTLVTVALAVSPVPIAVYFMGG